MPFLKNQLPRAQDTVKIILNGDESTQVDGRRSLKLIDQPMRGLGPRRGTGLKMDA